MKISQVLLDHPLEVCFWGFFLGLVVMGLVKGLLNTWSWRDEEHLHDH
ncbi:hypothetical protein [Desulfuromonas versatilis]|nr:hypothetical protein [Desulfuromonas versatilis]